MNSFFKINIFLLLFLTSSFAVQAQENDSFEDDPFTAQQKSMRRQPRRNAVPWMPSSYADQAAMLEARANAKIKRNLNYLFESAGTTGNGSHAPFWHTSNRQGLSSPDNGMGYMRFAAMGEMLLPSQFGVGYGMDLGLGTGMQENWFVHQLYIDLSYKWLDFELGMREHHGEFKNPSLSTGSLIWSGNSQPIPEIRIGLSDYTRLPILGNWFSIKGHVGYGRFTDDNWRSGQSVNNSKYATGILFHSKSAFVRFGDVKRFPLQATFGLEMNTMFGGTMYNGNVFLVQYDEYKFPSGPAAFWNALFPFNKAEEQGQDNGNVVGSWHLAFDCFLNEWKLSAYYEHFFEDHSSMLGVELKSDQQGQKHMVSYGMKRNWLDGLFGLEINAPDNWKHMRSVVLEFMNTRGQCGAVCNNLGPHAERVDGCDDMYNHGKYSSYSHWGYAIGNPVLISPVYNQEPGNQRFVSNRVRMFHVGVEGGLTEKLDYRILATSTTHWGSYIKPLQEKEQISSLMMELSYWLGDSYSWKFSLSGAMDFDDGNMLGNNKGLMLTISKLWKML